MARDLGTQRLLPALGNLEGARRPLEAQVSEYAANHLAGVAAIACMTASGYTPLIASRIRSGLPIVGLAHSPIAQRRMALYRGVVSLPFDTTNIPPEELDVRALRLLRDRGIAEPDDHVILTRGDHMNAHGGTNSMEILALDGAS